MDDKFSALSKFDSIDNVELNSVAGGFNKLAYQIGHGVGVAVNIVSTLRGFKGGRTKYRPKHLCVFCIRRLRQHNESGH